MEHAGYTLPEMIVHISTLKKGETIDVLLNPSDWHKEQLEEAEEIKTFEIVQNHERGCEYMVHISCGFETQTARTRVVCGVDLGIEDSCDPEDLHGKSSNIDELARTVSELLFTIPNIDGKRLCFPIDMDDSELEPRSYTEHIP